MPEARSLWDRWKFHASTLVVLVPVAALPEYLSDEMPTPATHVVRTETLGPWTVTVATLPEKPHRDEHGDLVKDYDVAFSGATDHIRAAYLRIGKPAALTEAGAPAHGTPYALHAHVEVPEKPTGREDLWLTVEGWDGTVHHASWPLAPMLGD